MPDMSCATLRHMMYSQAKQGAQQSWQALQYSSRSVVDGTVLNSSTEIASFVYVAGIKEY